MTKRQRITGRARGFLRSTRAVSALEYAILVGVIVVGVAAAIGARSVTDIDGKHSKIGSDGLLQPVPLSSEDH